MTEAAPTTLADLRSEIDRIDAAMHGLLMERSQIIEEQADRIVRQLGGKWQGDFAMCRCPAHADGKVSLSIRVGERAVLFHCFAGCTADAIMSALRTGKILAPANHDPGQRQDSKTDLNKLALAVWRHAEPFAGTLADRYLREGRSIVPDGINARFDPRCQCGAGAAKAFAPALIVPIEENAGVVAIHRTFLRPDGRWKADMDEPKRMLGNPGVGAVRWGGVPLDGILRLAEGVEDEGQALFLRSAGCERMQGYFFARPMPADQMEALLRQENAPEPHLAVAS